MTPEQQIKALAELDEVINPNLGEFIKPNVIFTEIYVVANKVGALRCVPRYRESFDAILPLIRKQTPEIRRRVANSRGPIGFDATPAEYCEWLLRAHGKWIED